MMMKRVHVLLALPLLLAGCATQHRHPTDCAPAEHPMHQAPRGKYLSRDMELYSVNMRGQGWRFLLMPAEFMPDSPGNYGNLYRLEELPRAFRGLPKGAMVVWRDDIFNAWIYPPKEIEDQVEKAANAAGIFYQQMMSLVHYR